MYFFTTFSIVPDIMMWNAIQQLFTTTRRTCVLLILLNLKESTQATVIPLNHHAYKSCDLLCSWMKNKFLSDLNMSSSKESIKVIAT